MIVLQNYLQKATGIVVRTPAMKEGFHLHG